ncbi:flavodoxin family protein [Cryobacterium cryoconiti]|uniref:Flavodoxin family protein n=1 Tax=Cryobacterium cryoconiti TaxID=1259239 RepID=A0A4Y8JXN8_9MICO|nr:flavodoxin family protein [Cryobacterium cryoconiti]TFD29000.1 flavodoxin family protein [Cryobacterium cryoconiti]
MSILVIFDVNSDTAVLSSTTESVAETVAVELGEGTSAVPVAGLGPDSLTGVKLLVVGSPVAGWRSPPRLQAFLAQLRPGTLRGVRAAAFDTRARRSLHGNSAGRMSRALEKAGAHVVAPPTGFKVDKRAGALAPGEDTRVAAWAGLIASALRR